MMGRDKTILMSAECFKNVKDGDMSDSWARFQNKLAVVLNKDVNAVDARFYCQPLEKRRHHRTHEGTG